MKNFQWINDTLPRGDNVIQLKCSDGYLGMIKVDQRGFVVWGGTKVIVGEANAKRALLRKLMRQKAQEINDLQELWNKT